MRIYSPKIIIFALLFIALFGFNAHAQSNDVTHVELTLSPRSGSFVSGTTFAVPILINTNKLSINAINIKVNFDPSKLAIIDPSGGKSVISFWTESPKYSNSQGNVTYVGTINEGLVTESGLVATITFKALALGKAVVSVDASSKVSLKDDLNTNAILDVGRAEYDILNKPAEGIAIFSETHPSENTWYNNNNPVLSWPVEPGASGFSFILDNKPFTVPDNVVDSTENTKSYENLTDGLWYFHVKALKNNAWGVTGHFMVKIDTVAPATFTPTINNFSASAILSNRSFVNFFTTDNLSGVDHYEIATIDNSQPISNAPVFIEATSPFQIPMPEKNTVKVIVRAFDRAGNLAEGYTEVAPPIKIISFIKNNLTVLLILLVLLVLTINYLTKYGIIKPLRRRDTLEALEDDMNAYIIEKKEADRENMATREKINVLEKELEDIKRNEGGFH